MTTMVKKLKLWMMAAILTLCGASVLTACSSNEETAKTMGYDVIITADHGNADHAVNADGTPNTTHSTNPVPFIYVTANKNATVRSGILADVAPSVLHIMGLQQPKEMTGQCLISE